MADYWQKFRQTRIGRRRALIATGSAGAAAAFLAACGGGGGDSEGGASGAKKDSSGLVSDIQDTSKSAKRGGTYRWSAASEPNHFDGGIQGQAQLNVFNGLAYGALVQNKPGYMQPTSNSEVNGDLAESWEFSGDKLQITFKLRQGVKWHNKAPVNGRAFDSSDVVNNWKRFEAKSPEGALMSKAKNPSGIVESVTAPDARTVIYKLASPTSYIMQRLGTMTTGLAGTVLPKEADNGFDPRTEQIGTGGFVLEKYSPSVSLVYKRNPDYWNKTEPYIDTLEIPIVPQYASGQSQFKAGNVYSYNILPQDILAVKKEAPTVSMYKNVTSGSNPAAMIGFGWLPYGSYQKSPFLDIRVRQAVSYSFDRDAFIDAFSNVSTFEKEGLPVDTFYYTSMAYVPNVWLDPRSKDFGPNGQYFTYNPTESKKLLSAAGFANGIEVESKFINGAQFGLDHQRQVEVLDGWAKEVGFKVTGKPLDYNIEYLPQIVTAQGKFTGWAYRFGATTSGDPMDYFAWRYWSKSGPTSGALGFDVNGRGDQSGDPTVDSLIEKGLTETDSEKRKALIHDLQRHLAKQVYGVTRPGVGSGFQLAWPAVGNYQVFQGDSRASAAGQGGTPYTWWVDDTKAPIKKA
ncbi:MAG TPA: ABC transporter substrate-binding protein [Dehalococcoidia bacterium]|nr:ABC transporter substrate-binding protein [Dehalococcoidia bacterium]